MIPPQPSRALTSRKYSSTNDKMPCSRSPRERRAAFVVALCACARESAKPAEKINLPRARALLVICRKKYENFGIAIKSNNMI